MGSPSFSGADDGGGGGGSVGIDAIGEAGSCTVGAGGGAVVGIAFSCGDGGDLAATSAGAGSLATAVVGAAEAALCCEGGKLLLSEAEAAGIGPPSDLWIIA